MARSVDDINNQIVTELVANFATVGIVIDPTKWSKRNIMRLMCFTIAVISAYIEQLIDVATSNIETLISKSVGASAIWIQNKMFSFQYSSDTTQVLSIVDNVIIYNTIDTSLQIIKACSVTSMTENNVIIKVAKSNPLEKLSSNELISAQGYIDWIGTAGINYIVQSVEPDIITLQLTVWYKKQYSATIQDDVINAILNLYETLSITNFNGALKMTDIENAIRNVTGVNDVLLQNVSARGGLTAFGLSTPLIVNNQVLSADSRQWFPVAGYCTQETEVGHRLTDNGILTLVSE